MSRPNQAQNTSTFNVPELDAQLNNDDPSYAGQGYYGLDIFNRYPKKEHKGESRRQAAAQRQQYFANNPHLTDPSALPPNFDQSSPCDELDHIRQRQHVRALEAEANAVGGALADQSMEDVRQTVAQTATKGQSKGTDATATTATGVTTTATDEGSSAGDNGADARRS